MNHKRMGLVALFLVVAFMAGCAGKAEPTQSLPTLKIGQIPTIDGLPFWVAESKAFYQESGVNVELVNFKSAQERDAALVAGQIDGALTDIPGAVTLHGSGTRLQIASINLGATKEEGPVAILAAPNSGISSAEDLKGVEVAISKNSFIHYVTEMLLLENGLQPEEINTIAIPQIPVRFENLIAGTVQAATLPEPLLSLAVQKGAKVILTDAEAQRNYSMSVIAFTEGAVSAKAEAITRFFGAYNQAVDAIAADPEAFKDLLATKASLPAEIKDSWRVTTFSRAQPPGRAEVEPVIDWLLAKGLLAKKVTYDELLNQTLTRSAAR